MTVSFDITDTDRAMVAQIADRAATAGLIRGPVAPDHWYDRETMEMDLTAANANGNPMDFQALLDAEGLTFTHDIAGIAKHMDRETGKMPCFRPRTSREEPDALTTTADIGELIRDMIEDTSIVRDLHPDEPLVSAVRDHVETVDITDPHNPRIVMASGAVFVARIVREA